MPNPTTDVSDLDGPPSAPHTRFGWAATGCALVGWLTATGTAVVATAALIATGAVVRLTALPAAESIGGVAATTTVGVTAALVLVLIVFLAYYCGGYVAGRLAPITGRTQGALVWLWAVVISSSVAGVSAVAGNTFDILTMLNSFPRLPIGRGPLVIGSTLTVVAALVLSLAGAVLGGHAATVPAARRRPPHRGVIA